MKSLTEFESKRLLNEFGLVSCKESVATTCTDPVGMTGKKSDQPAMGTVERGAFSKATRLLKRTAPHTSVEQTGT